MLPLLIADQSEILFLRSSRMMYDMGLDSFPDALDDNSDTPTTQWPLVKNDSIKLVVEIGSIYDREGENGLFYLTYNGI